MKRLLITGAASGIGLAAAERMSASMEVVLADLDGERALAAAEEIRRKGGRAAACQLDVTNALSVEQMMSAISRDIGPIDALFNNAGISLRGAVTDIHEGDWDRMMDTHVKGTFLCCKAVLPQMCERGSGVIVNMSSDYAVKGMAGGAAYAAAKTAVYSLTKSLASEFIAYGIRVNALGPGPIDTPLLQAGRSGEIWARAKAVRADQVPMGRIGTPAEVAAVLEFLLCDRSAYMTGQIIHPNGGQISW